MDNYVNSGEGYFVDVKDPSRGFYGIPPGVDKKRNDKWEKKFKCRESSAELEALRKIYDSLESIKLRIIDRPGSVKTWLKKGGLTKILDKTGKEIWLSDADSEDLEKFCLYKFTSFGWELPENYYDRK